MSYLRKYISIDSIGKCDNSAPWPMHKCTRNTSSGNSCIEPDQLGDALRRYRFYLAFENTCETGYVTEKVYNGLDAGVIPVYLGAPDIADYVPKGSILGALYCSPIFLS